MATKQWAEVLSLALFGRELRQKKELPKAETVNTSGISTWVEQVSWTPLTKHIGLIGFKPKNGKWYTVPNQTYDVFLQLIKDSLSPGSGTGTQMWRFGFLGGRGFVRQRSDAVGKFIAGFEQQKAIRELAREFRKGGKSGKKALAAYVGKFGSQAASLALRLVTGLSSALLVARMLA